MTGKAWPDLPAISTGTSATAASSAVAISNMYTCRHMLWLRHNITIAQPVAEWMGRRIDSPTLWINTDVWCIFAGEICDIETGGSGDGVDRVFSSDSVVTDNL